MANFTLVAGSVTVIRFLMAFESNCGPIRRFVGTERTEVDAFRVFVVQHVGLHESHIPEDFPAHLAGRWIVSVDVLDVFVHGVARRAGLAAVIACEDGFGWCAGGKRK